MKKDLCKHKIVLDNNFQSKDYSGIEIFVYHCEKCGKVFRNAVINGFPD